MTSKMSDLVEMENGPHADTKTRLLGEKQFNGINITPSKIEGTDENVPNDDVDGLQLEVVDVNAYQHKKTLAQGMMDLALLSANANQLRYVLETNTRHPYYYASLVFISLSIIFQIVVGVGLILNSRYNIEDKKEVCRANKVNNYTVIGIFIVTVVNVFISAFGVADPTAGAN